MMIEMKGSAHTREDLAHRLRERGNELRAKGVARLGLFGSVARGEAGPKSALDVFVEFAPGEKTYDNFLEVAFLLEDIAGGPVELVTRESLSPHIGLRILGEVVDVDLGP